MPTPQPSLVSIQAISSIALFAALIAAGAMFHVSIGLVPVTFQDVFVVIAGFILGPKRVVYALALYILAGVIGLPVFSGGRSGIGHILGPTGGYFVGFFCLAICSAVTSSVTYKKFGAPKNFRESQTHATNAEHATHESTLVICKRFFLLITGGLIGLALLYFFGYLWLMYRLQLTSTQAFATGIAPFLPFGITKVLICSLIWHHLARRGFIST